MNKRNFNVLIATACVAGSLSAIAAPVKDTSSDISLGGLHALTSNGTIGGESERTPAKVFDDTRRVDQYAVDLKVAL